jgi:hypothetical protein
VDDTRVDVIELSPRRLRKRSETQSVGSKIHAVGSRIDSVGGRINSVGSKMDSKSAEAVRNKLPPGIKRPSITGRDSGRKSSKASAERRGSTNSTVQATKTERRKSIKETPLSTQRASQARDSAPRKPAGSSIPVSPRSPKTRTIPKKKVPITPTSPHSKAKRPPPLNRTTETRRLPLLSLFHNTSDIEDSANDEDFIPSPDDEHSSDDQLSAVSSDDAVSDSAKSRRKSKTGSTKASPPDLDLTKKKKKKRVRFDDGTWRPSKGRDEEEEEEDEDELTWRTPGIGNRGNVEGALDSDTVRVVLPSLGPGRAKRERKRTAKAIDGFESQQPKKRKQV